MRAQTAKLYQWATAKAGSEKSSFWLLVLFLLEILLILPLDAILMFFCLQNRKKTLLYVLLAAVASTASAAVGYLVGHFLWDLIGPYLVPSLIPASSFETVSVHFQAYEHWAVFLGGIIPFPLKVLSLASGIFSIGLVPFMTYFFAARVVRFLASGVLMWVWGDKVKTFLDKHFHSVILAIGAKCALVSFFLWILAK